MFINAAMFTVFFYESKFENSFHLLFSSSISFNVFKFFIFKIMPKPVSVFVWIYACMWCPEKPDRGSWIPWSWGSRRLWVCYFWGPALGPLQEWLAFFTMEPELSGSGPLQCFTVFSALLFGLRLGLSLGTLFRGRCCVDFPLWFLSQHVCYST